MFRLRPYQEAAVNAVLRTAARVANSVNKRCPTVREPGAPLRAQGIVPPAGGARSHVAPGVTWVGSPLGEAGPIRVSDPEVSRSHRVALPNP